jgi:hypothetical protein
MHRSSAASFSIPFPAYRRLQFLICAAGPVDRAPEAAGISTTRIARKTPGRSDTSRRREVVGRERLGIRYLLWRHAPLGTVAASGSFPKLLFEYSVFDLANLMAAAHTPISGVANVGCRSETGLFVTFGFLQRRLRVMSPYLGLGRTAQG